MKIIIALLAVFILGGIFGVFTTAIVVAASEADDMMERFWEKENERERNE